MIGNFIEKQIMKQLEAFINKLKSRIDYEYRIHAGKKKQLINNSELYQLVYQVIEDWKRLNNEFSNDAMCRIAASNLAGRDMEVSVKEEFDLLMSRFEDTIDQATDCLNMLCRKRLFKEHKKHRQKLIGSPSSIDRSSLSTDLVSLRDISFVHDEWEANEMIRVNVPRCESRVIAKYGDILGDLVQQLCRFIHARLDELKERFNKRMCTMKDAKMLLWLLDLGRERFSIHWQFYRIYTDMVGLMYRVIVADQGEFSHIMYLLSNASDRCAAGQVEQDGWIVVLSEGFLSEYAHNGHEISKDSLPLKKTSLRDFLQWTGERTDLFDTEYIVCFRESKSHLQAFLQPVMIGEQDALALQLFLDSLKNTSEIRTSRLIESNENEATKLVNLDFDNQTSDVFIMSMSAYCVQLSHDSISRELGSSKCSQLFPPNPDVSPVTKRLFDAITEAEELFGMIVISTPSNIGEFMNSFNWNEMCHVAVEAGLRILQSNCYLKHDIFDRVFRMTLGSSQKWLSCLDQIDINAHADNSQDIAWYLLAVEKVLILLDNRRRFYSFGWDACDKEYLFVLEQLTKFANHHFEHFQQILHSKELIEKYQPVLCLQSLGLLRQNEVRYENIVKTIYGLCEQLRNLELHCDFLLKPKNVANEISHSNYNDLRPTIFEIPSWTKQLANLGYELVGPIGSGCNGTVYQAIELNTGQFVAIKVSEITPEFVSNAITFHVTSCGFDSYSQSFSQSTASSSSSSSSGQSVEGEANLLKTIRHTNIVSVKDVFTIGTNDDFTVSSSSGEKVHGFMVMEFCEGGSLHNHFKKSSLWGKIAAIKHFGRNVLQGLMYLHMRHMVHGDLKPENVLISSPDLLTLAAVAKLADFGMAHVSDRIHLSPIGLGCYGGYVGTVSYMAPEVLRGNKPSYKSDIWSFGCILQHLLTGILPWSHIGSDWNIIFTIGAATDSFIRENIVMSNNEELNTIMKACLNVQVNCRPSSLTLLTNKFFKSAE